MNDYTWLLDKDCCSSYLNSLKDCYDKYISESSTSSDLLNDIELYTNLVVYVIGYRYLVSKYSSLFSKLNISVEEYLDYRSKKLFNRIKNKNKRIDDICSYIYRSLQLSNQLQIYEYSYSCGNCNKIKTKNKVEIARNDFFNISIKNNQIENTYIFYEFDSCDKSIDDNASEKCVLDIDKKSYIDFTSQNIDYGESISKLIERIKSIDCLDKPKSILIYILTNWEDSIESDYNATQSKISDPIGYGLSDYITYKYKTGKLNITEEEYLDILKILKYIM